MSNITLENTRFNECVRTNPKGSTFLGYAYTELTVPGALDDGSDLKVGMPDIEVRKTVDGKPRVDFPEDLKILRDNRSDDERAHDAEEGFPFLRGDIVPNHLVDEIPEGCETKRVARYFSANAETREAITDAVFALPQVSRAVEKSAPKRSARKRKSA
jgi:hypothetical protein